MDENLKTYCYLATRDKDLKFPDSGHEFRKISSSDQFESFFMNSGGNSSDTFLSVLNDLEDYNVEDIIKKSLSGKSDATYCESLVSAARAGGRDFACAADPWGIQTHYWFKDEDTFICGNNIFFVASLIDPSLSRTSLFEYLFFLSPVGDKTWFEKIHRLRPGQSLNYRMPDHALDLSSRSDPSEKLLEVDSVPKSIEEETKSFFRRSKEALSGKGAAVLLSAGSDSRTVLSCLRKYDFHLTAYSFGSPSFIETREIERLCSRFDIEWKLVDIKAMEDKWEERFRNTTLQTSGSINPLRTHYQLLYDSIPSDQAVFEGIFGSEFIKGELCIGATIGKSYSDVIADGEGIKETVETNFPGLSSSLKKEMAEYIADVHGKDLLDINTAAGFRKYNSLAFSILPGRIFSGMILLGSSNHKTYYPFLSFDILRSLFARRMGVVKNVSIRDDFPGPISDIRPESIIVREMDGKIYGSVLDRGISFREALESPLFLARIKKKAREIVKRFRYRDYFHGQIDNRQIELKMEAYAEEKSRSNPLVAEFSKEPRLAKETANISMILETLKEFRR